MLHLVDDETTRFNLFFSSTFCRSTTTTTTMQAKKVLKYPQKFIMSIKVKVLKKFCVIFVSSFLLGVTTRRTQKQFRVGCHPNGKKWVTQESLINFLSLSSQFLGKWYYSHFSPIDDNTQFIDFAKQSFQMTKKRKTHRKSRDFPNIFNCHLNMNSQTHVLYHSYYYYFFCTSSYTHINIICIINRRKKTAVVEWLQ